MNERKETKFDYLIIGGGVAGTTAAETIRNNDPAGSVAIVSEEPYRLYSRVMLSKPDFFLERIPFEKVWLKDEGWYRENKIALLSGKKAVGLDIGEKTVHLKDGQVLRYGKLLLAPGTAVRRCNFIGADKPGIYYLRTLEDAKLIIAALKQSQKVVVIGGGFIGFEMCDLAVLAGRQTTIIIREPHYWDPVLDKPSGEMIEQALKKSGVEVLLNSEVAEAAGNGKVEEVILKDRRRIACDMVVAGIGCEPPLAWVKAAGIKTGRGILANEFLETSAKDVWTAGDAAEYQDIILEETVMMGNWVNAQQQGRLAGLNMVGKRTPFKFVSFYTTQGLGITIAFAGDVRLNGDKRVVNRGLPAAGSYGRLIISYGEVVGATLINRTEELGVIRKLIEKDIKVSGLEDKLSDPNFDLKKLLTG